MKILELKTFLESLPIEFNEFDISMRSFSKDEEITFMLDKPIVSVYVDEENTELCLLDQENSEFLEKITNKNEDEENNENTSAE